MAGNQGGMKSLGYFSYGLQVFDLCTDQICRFMETPDMDKGAILMIIVAVYIILVHGCLLMYVPHS